MVRVQKVGNTLSRIFQVMSMMTLISNTAKEQMRDMDVEPRSLDNSGITEDILTHDRFDTDECELPVILNKF